MPPLEVLDTLSNADLKRLVIELWGKIAELERQVGERIAFSAPRCPPVRASRAIRTTSSRIWTCARASFGCGASAG